MLMRELKKLNKQRNMFVDQKTQHIKDDNSFEADADLIQS